MIREKSRYLENQGIDAEVGSGDVVLLGAAGEMGDIRQIEFGP